MAEPIAEPSLFDAIPEAYRDDPAVKEYMRLLAGYALQGTIVPSEAMQLAAYAGLLLGTHADRQPA
jgi:hypothetical protein